ncbi:MAG: hypothetical protein ACU0BS_06945 [Hasllibacter sp.]
MWTRRLAIALADGLTAVIVALLILFVAGGAWAVRDGRDALFWTGAGLVWAAVSGLMLRRPKGRAGSDGPRGTARRSAPPR